MLSNNIDDRGQWTYSQILQPEFFHKKLIVFLFTPTGILFYENFCYVVLAVEHSRDPNIRNKLLPCIIN